MTRDDVRLARKELNATRVQFAAWVGVSRRTVERWESGFVPPNRSAVQTIKLLLERHRRSIPVETSMAYSV